MLDNSTNKFQLGIVYLFAILAVIGIGPFVYLRYIRGEGINALLDLAIVSSAVCSALYARWRGEATPATRYFAACFYTAGAIVVVYFNDPIFMFWIFPTILANFFLLRPRQAIFLNLFAIAIVIPVAMKIEKTLDILAILSSLFFVTIMAYLFARLTEGQRKRLEIFASQDPLTMLGNRRSMDEELRLCAEDFARYHTPATLIVFDLDKFKIINDKFGHSVGDKLLADIGKLMSTRLRKTDRAFRFGGEEFVLLARNTKLPEAAIIADNIREQIASEINGPKGKISASFGCASIQPEETCEQWFVRADRAMYQAKDKGRNCVVLAEE
jgi:diguanylate cyclase (GGDEF)-like protein